MKAIVLVACVAAPQAPTTRPAPAPAEAAIEFADVSIDEALARAAVEKRYVFVAIDAENEPWDLRGKGWLLSHVAAALRPLWVRVPASRRAAMAERFRPSEEPTVVVLAPTGDEWLRIAGSCRPRDFSIDVALRWRRDDPTNGDALREELASFDQRVEKEPRSVMARAMRSTVRIQAGLDGLALEDVLWCWDRGVASDPGNNGSRLTHVVSEWTRLARRHPPALDAMRLRIEALRRAILDESRGDDLTLQDLVTLGGALSEGPTPLDLLDHAPDSRGCRAFLAFSAVDTGNLRKPHGLKALRYEAKGRLQWLARRPEMEAVGMPSGQTPNAIALGCREMVLRWLESVLAAGRAAEAAECVNRALATEHSDAMLAALVQAARAAGSNSRALLEQGARGLDEAGKQRVAQVIGAL